MLKRIIVLIFISSLLLSACSPAASFEEAPVEPAAEPPRAGMPEMDSGGFAEGTTNSYGQGEFASGVEQAQTERLVVKNASLSLVVDDPDRSLDNITSLAEAMGGFVVTANLSEMVLDSGAKAPRGNITIRVPAERFNEALERIKSETQQPPVSESINSQDVTGEYTDLESRLRNLEAAEDQLTEIMGSATRTEDVLAVYNQLIQVREQIEVIKGQMQYYEQSAAMSAISVDLVANAAVQPLTVGGWQPEGTAREAVQALINTLKTLGSLVIWIVIWLVPVLLVLFVIFVLPLRLIWRAWRRGHPKAIKKAVPPEAMEKGG